MRKFAIAISAGCFFAYGAAADDGSPATVAGMPALRCSPMSRLSGPQPDGTQLATYPKASIAAHEEGHVLIDYTIGKDGTVDAVHLSLGSGHARLDAAALAGAKDWRFTHTANAEFFLPMHSIRYVDFSLPAGAAPLAAAGNVCLPPPPVSIVNRPVPVGPHNLNYPQAAVLDGEEGTVTVGFVVLADGSVGDAKVVVSSGHPLLDQAAIDSVQAWRYQPREAPVPMRVQLNFKLQDAAPANP